MQIIINNLQKEPIDGNNNYKNTCFIDIETTGLSRKYNIIYLIGILYLEDDKWYLLQIFADKADEEEKLLRYFVNIISKYSQIITYNGESFDIPFINYRLEKYGIAHRIAEDTSLDLYRLVKRNRDFLDLEDLKLKSLERYLGIYRDDIYSGKDCIDFYLEYSRTGDVELAERVLKHNFDDLFYMLDIIKIISILNEKKTLKIHFNDFEMSLLLHDSNIKGDLFKLRGSIKSEKNIKLIYFDNSYKLSFMDDNTFELVLEIHEGFVSPNTKGIYIDKNDLNLSRDLCDASLYKLADNIILLKVEKDYCITNIMKVLEDIVKNSVLTLLE